MHAETETSFLANLNQNIGIVHQVCHAYFRRDAAVREDVFQDIMYQLWKSYPRFQGESKFSTWMYKVALNTAITHIRRSTRTPRNTELTESVAIAPHMNEHVSRRELLLVSEYWARSGSYQEESHISGGINATEFSGRSH